MPRWRRALDALVVGEGDFTPVEPPQRVSGLDLPWFVGFEHAVECR